MPYYAKAKVYCDGNHYIAIPHTTRPKKPRKAKSESLMTVDENNNLVEETEEISKIVLPDGQILTEIEIVGDEIIPVKKKKSKGRKVSRKELFEKLYTETNGKRRNERKNSILAQMKGCFKSEDVAKVFIELNFQRKLRNLICRRIRMCRKAYLNGMNYFCTFTYDDKLQTEQSFETKLKNCLQYFSKKRGWKYMGVWERGKKTDRLHFHALMHIPKEQLEGKLEEKREYDFKSKDMKITNSHSFFEKKFGRNDFKEIPSVRLMSEALAYLMKYLEKTGEKAVYSRGLSQYLISDILDEDVVCTIGQEEKKLLLFDDFNCIDEGEIKGRISPEVIKEMPKAN